jgi:hypothetical protein
MAGFPVVTETKLISDLLALSPKRRARLRASCSGVSTTRRTPDEKEVNDAWAKELTRRVEKIRTGKVKLVSGDTLQR